jgi:nucleolar protein 14
MGKRKYNKSSSQPKGLPFKKSRPSKDGIGNINPFESARASSAKSPKFHVHNRPVSGRVNPSNPLKGAGSALKRAIDNRRNGLKVALNKSKKAGSFIDRRIGESRKSEMTEEERILARIVRERSRRSKKINKFSLDDDGDGDQGLSLTHRGKVIDDSYTGKLEADDIILSDDEEERYGGQLEKADTELHFGGGTFDRARRKEASNNPYGPSTGATGETMGDRYRSRKEELDDLIMRKKFEKAEKARSKEKQSKFPFYE